MNREKRLRRLKAMNRAQIIALGAEYEPLTEEDLENIPFIPPSEDQWGNHELLLTDPTLEFAFDDIDDVIKQSMNQAWITIPAKARELGIPNLYYLDPTRATEYEKYFGIYVPEYGYIHTPATSALHNALVAVDRGSVTREGKLGKQILVKFLMAPSNYPTKSGMRGQKLLTLDPESERKAIAAAPRALEEAHGNPDLMRRMRVRPGGVEMTSSHSRGVREIPTGTDVTPEITRKLQLLERAMNKDITKYPRLQKTVDTMNSTLKARMDSFQREFRSVNRGMNFEEFSREEMEDIVRQGILRMFIKSLLEGKGAAFSDTELGLPSEYRVK